MSTAGVRSPVRWVRPCRVPGTRSTQVVQRRRLVCFPHAGGTAQAYRDWPGGLPGDVGVHAVQYPGRQDRLRESAVSAIEEFVEPVVEELTGFLAQPLTLFGHSMGAIVAYEVAQELERRYGAVVDLLVVSGSRSPTDRENEDKHLLDDGELSAEIIRINESFGELLADRQLLELVLPAIRSDYQAISSYRRDRAEPVKAPIVALGGTADPDVDRAQLDGWEDFTLSGFRRLMFPGDHFYLSDEQALLPVLAGLLPAPAPRGL